MEQSGVQKCKIAGVGVDLFPRGLRLRTQTEKYLCRDFERPADITIKVREKYLNDCLQKHPELNYEEWEYMLTGSEFYRQLLFYEGALLHSSAVVVDGGAYLFSGNPGTGKSTHTGLWLKHFGRERAYILNDDKPALRYQKGEVFAYGTPWSGKTNRNVNKRAPVKGITFLEQSESNYIRPLAPGEIVPLFLEQTLRSLSKEQMENLLNLLEHIVKRVPCYKMGCNISTEAVELSWKTMSHGRVLK